MFLSSLIIKRVGPRRVLLVAMFFFVIRIVLTGVASAPATIIGVQVFQGLSFRFLLPASVRTPGKVGWFRRGITSGDMPVCPIDAPPRPVMMVAREGTHMGASTCALLNTTRSSASQSR